MEYGQICLRLQIAADLSIKKGNLHGDYKHLQSLVMFFSFNVEMNFNVHHHLLFIDNLVFEYLNVQVFFMTK